MSESDKDFTCISGATASVAHPALSCVKEQERDKYVTKIFKNHGSIKSDFFYEQEKNVYDQFNKKLKRIDPKEEFFLSHYTECNYIDKKELEKQHCGVNETNIGDEDENNRQKFLKFINSNKKEKKSLKSQMRNVNRMYRGNTIEAAMQRDFLFENTMRIKKSNPARRKSFRARHNCANPGPRHKARYWSCRSW